MVEESTANSLIKNKVKHPTTCLDVGKSIIENEEDESEVLTNVFVHVYDVEAREFTSYTTFHGMIRIFNSQNWTSLIYWSFVVLMCLTFYYFYTFDIIYRYTLKPSYQKIDYVTHNEDEFVYPELVVCPVNPYSRTALDQYLNESNYDVSSNFFDLNLRPGRWQLSDFNNRTGANFSISKIDQLQKKLTKNCYEIVGRTVINENTVNLCENSEFVNIGHGYCLFFDLRKRKEIYESVTIGFKNQDPDGYRIFIEPHGTHPLTFSNVVHLMPNTRISVHTKLRNNTFLSKTKGGNCIQNWDGIPLGNHLHDTVGYSMKTCELVRAAHLSLKTKNCIPFSLKKLFRKKFPICDDVIEVPGFLESYEISSFTCYPECEKQELLFTRISTRHMNDISGIRNISIIKISFDKHTKLIRSQSRLLHLVDILAKLGGNTSLFCGFSCVTLMETFIFLFKSIVHLAHYGTVGPVEDEKTSKKEISNLIPIEVSLDSKNDNIENCNQKKDGQSRSLPSTPVNSDVPFSFPKKNSLPTSQYRLLQPKFSIIDTISEKDEFEVPKTPINSSPRSSVSDKMPWERRMRPSLRRLRTRDRFRDSINSMTFDTRYRVNEPFVGFQTSIDQSGFQGPLQQSAPRASLISTEQGSVGSGLRRLNSTKRKSLYRYNSGLGDF